VIDEAITTTAKSKEKWSEAEIERVAGELALILPEANAAQAEAHFERALGVAREQQAKSWELRAATSLARLWRDRGKSDDSMSCAVSGNRIRLARQLIGGFREGFRVPRIGMQVAGRDHWHGCSDQAPFLTELRTRQRSK
jgi:hypothetical protein